MAKNTRYDALRNAIERDLTFSQTFAPALSGGESELLVNVSDPDFQANDRFQKYAPFNSVTVVNRSSAAMRVYLSSDRTTYVDVPAGETANVLERTPKRYIRFLRVENKADATAINDGEVEIQVGNAVDSVELDLLKMSGLLDITE